MAAALSHGCRADGLRRNQPDASDPLHGLPHAHAELVDCDSSLITPACGLTGVLDEALAAFMAVLGRYMLADILKKRSKLLGLFATELGEEREVIILMFADASAVRQESVRPAPEPARPSPISLRSTARANRAQQSSPGHAARTGAVRTLRSGPSSNSSPVPDQAKGVAGALAPFGCRNSGDV